MKFSRRFKSKYKDELNTIFSSKDYEVLFEAWDSIINSDAFDEEDLIEILDVLMKRGVQKAVFDFNPINNLIYYDKIDQMMFELDKDDIDKYKAYFLSLNNIYTLNSMSEFIISFYGNKLKWDVILTNTLYEKVDRELINNNAFDMIAYFHEIMFSTEIDNDNYEPAQESLFFKCLELGAELPYNYLRNSIYQNNTTFSTKLYELFQYCLATMDTDGYTGFVEVTSLNSSEELESFNICVELIVRRLSFDYDLCDFLEKQLDIEEDDVNLKGVTFNILDDDDDDDLGF